MLRFMKLSLAVNTSANICMQLKFTTFVARAKVFSAFVGHTSNTIFVVSYTMKVGVLEEISKSKPLPGFLALLPKLALCIFRNNFILAAIHECHDNDLI